MKPHIAVSILLSVIALALMFLQLVDPGRVDAWVVALLGIGFLPWLWPIFESIGFPGGSVKFRELKEKQEKQQDDIRILQFLIAHFLTNDEKTHLRNLDSQAHFPLSPETPRPFFDEMRRLRALGFIAQRTKERGVSFMDKERRGEVSDYFDLSETGRQYLDLLAKTRQWPEGKPSG